MAQDVRYELMKNEQRNQVLQFLFQHFLYLEPTNRAVNLTEPDARFIFPHIIASTDPNLSFLALNQESEIVGCCLNHADEFTEDEGILDYIPENARHILQLLELVEKDKEKLLPQDQKRLKCDVISVHSSYFRKGIAKSLLEMSFENAKNNGFVSVCTVCSAIGSQQLFAKLGFDTVKTVPHENYFGEGGSRVFNCDDGTDCAKLVHKIL